MLTLQLSKLTAPIICFCSMDPLPGVETSGGGQQIFREMHVAQ